MVLDYMKMPSEMNTYDMPSFPEESELERCPQAMSILADIQLMLGQINENGQSSIMTLTELPEADLNLLNQILGEGEVSVLIDGDKPVRIQETVAYHRCSFPMASSCNQAPCRLLTGCPARLGH